MYFRCLQTLSVTLLFLSIATFSWALKIGDDAPDWANLRDYHGKSNVVAAFYLPSDAGFASKLKSRTEAFSAKYDADIVTQQSDKDAIVIVDKSGHVRWVFDRADNTDRPTIEVIETELAKLKRTEPLPIGSPAPDFSLTEADGKTIFTLSDYNGKKHVLVTLLLQTY